MAAGAKLEDIVELAMLHYRSVRGDGQHSGGCTKLETAGYDDPRADLTQIKRDYAAYG